MDERLINLAPTPSNLIEPGHTEAWPDIEAEFGTGLPTDFKEIIDRYGVGRFGNYIYLFNPFGSNQPTYKQWAGDLLQDYLTHQTKWPDLTASFSAFPEPGGLLPWGYTKNASWLLWKTVGEPDQWPLVLLDADLTKWASEYEMTISTFLSEWLLENVIVEFFPDDLEVMAEGGFRPGRN